MPVKLTTEQDVLKSGDKIIPNELTWNWSSKYKLNVKTMTIKATNDIIWVVREVTASEKSGILIPDSAKKSAHKGKIITVGELVTDKSISEGRIAVFNKSAGFPLEEEGIEYTILHQIDIVGTDAAV